MAASTTYRVAITECRNTLDELRPRKLKGYGALVVAGVHREPVALVLLRHPRHRFRHALARPAPVVLVLLLEQLVAGRGQ